MYWMHRLSSLAVQLVPTPVICLCLDLLAPWVAWLWPGQRLRAERNLRRVLGHDAHPALVRRTVRNVFRNYARYMLDLLRLPQADLAHFQREVAVHGGEHFEQATRANRGIILATGHIGNWDRPAVWLAGQGYRVNVPVETLKPERWNEQVQSLRRAAGLNAIPIESGVRRMVQALKNAEILGVVVDRPLAEGGVAVEFFGAITRVPTGIAKLALRTGATLLAAAEVRDGGRPTIYVSPPIAMPSTGDEQRDVQALTQEVMSWLEALIRRYPDQWYMFRDMWPTSTPMATEPSGRRLLA